MRATLNCLGAMLLAAVAASPASAGPPGPPYCYPLNPGCAPDFCCQGTYPGNPWNGYHGPVSNVYPSFPPWQGLLPAPQPGGGGFPTHPYCRSPRDFFMYETREDRNYQSIR